jgi:hypothetical protein
MSKPPARLARTDRAPLVASLFTIASLRGRQGSSRPPRSPDDFVRSGESVQWSVVRLDREGLHDLAAQAERPANRVRSEQGQQAVVIARASTQTETSIVKCQAGHEDPVQLARLDLREIGTWLRNAPDTRSQVTGWVSDSIEAQRSGRTIDARADD